MSYQAFEKLLAILRPMITVDAAKSNNSCPNASSHIYPELIMHIGLRWLAGGSYIDILDSSGVSDASFYRCRDMFMDAVLASDELDIALPASTEQVREAALRFKSKSSHGVMQGCVGCLDGILIEIKMPVGVTNQRAYFSGHYNCYGLNVQAVCDERLRFIYIAVAGPGNTADVTAYNDPDLSLMEFVEGLPSSSSSTINQYVLEKRTERNGGNRAKNHGEKWW